MERNHYLLLCLVLIGYFHCFVESTTLPVLSAPITYVGAIENVRYYAFNSTHVTWNEARQLCLNSGMELATVTTIAQRDFLAYKVPRQLGNFFWSAATDPRDINILQWPDGSNPNKSIIPGLWIAPEIPRICGQIYFLNTGDTPGSVMDLIGCDRKSRPLCQIACPSCGHGVAV